MRLTKRAQKLINELERTWAGSIRLVSVTRERCTLIVENERWIFTYQEGQLFVGHTIKAPDGLPRLAFFKAWEAMLAVIAGHSEATERRREEKIRRRNVIQLELRL